VDGNIRRRAAAAQVFTPLIVGSVLTGVVCFITVAG